MSHYCYDFLVDSFLFSETFLNERDTKSVTQIVERYIKHCNDHLNQVVQEIRNTSTDGVRSVVNPFDNPMHGLRDTDLMNHAIFQDLVIVPDPLYSFCLQYPDRNTQDTFSRSMGLSQHSELQELRSICRYMKDVTPFVANGFLKFFPADPSVHGTGIRLLYSPTGFAEVFEKNVLEWIRSQAIVTPMVRSCEGFHIEKGKKLSPCRSIHVEFDGSGGECSRMYVLRDIIDADVDSNELRMAMSMNVSDDPPDEGYFQQWVYQSVNQTAVSFLERARREAYLAGLLDAKFCPQNDFVLRFITKTFGVRGETIVDDRLSRPITFGIDLPVGANVDEFFRFRSDKTALLSFRRYLGDRLDDLTSLNDDLEIQRVSKKIQEELTNKHLPQVRNELSNFRMKEALRWIAIAAGMGVGFMSQGGPIGGLIALGLSAQGLRATKDNLDKIKALPGFFWNRIAGQRSRFLGCGSRTQ